jgi:small-conductance mechanosensitive channel/CRP-like cAMP-binding protein
LFHLIAQVTETTTKTVVEPIYHFDAGAWIPNGQQFLRGTIVAGGILIAGLIILAVARKYISRVRLTAAYLVAMVALAVYFSIGVTKPDRFRDPLDTATFWVHRVFYAALLFVVIRIVDRIILVPLMTKGGKVPLPRFVHQIVIIVLGLFAVLGYGSHAFGWDIDKFLAGSAVVSIVLGLALQETLGNFFSGLVMQASSPFAIGNWIIVAGVQGRVVDMNWRAVTIHTSDDNFVVIPNSTIAKEQITNFHAPTVATARNVMVGLEYELGPCEAIETLKAAALETPGVLSKPEPRIYLQDYANSAIVYRVKFWIDDPSNHPWIEHQVRLNTWYRLKQKGFNIPFQIQTVEMVNLQKKLALDAKEAAAARLRAIESVPLLSPLSSEQKQELAVVSKDCQLAPGQVLFSQGDSGDSFYVIHKGDVDVLIGDTPETQKSIATLSPGDFFGEMSALTGQPRTATIRARDALIAVEINKQALNRIFELDPTIMERISQVVTKRNVEREAARKGLAQPSTQEVVEQQKSLLGRMLRFFGRER